MPVGKRQETDSFRFREALVVAKRDGLGKFGALCFEHREKTPGRADAGPGDDTLTLQPATHRRQAQWTSAVPVH